MFFIRKLRHKRGELLRALEGTFNDDQRWMLRHQLDQLDSLEKQRDDIYKEVDRRMQHHDIVFVHVDAATTAVCFHMYLLRRRAKDAGKLVVRILFVFIRLAAETTIRVPKNVLTKLKHGLQKGADSVSRPLIHATADYSSFAGLAPFFIRRVGRSAAMGIETIVVARQVLDADPLAMVAAKVCNNTATVDGARIGGFLNSALRGKWSRKPHHRRGQIPPRCVGSC